MTLEKMGIFAVVNHTGGDRHATDYHLHGYGRFAGKPMVAVSIIAMSSPVSDDILLSVLEDDRVGTAWNNRMGCRAQF